MTNSSGVGKIRVRFSCPAACRTFTPLFYCTVNQLLVDLVPFVGDVLLPYHLLQKMACLQQQPFYISPLSGNTRVSRHQKKHSPTHHPDHHPIFISFFHLLRSIASSLFKLRASQSLHNLFPRHLSSTSWSGALHLIFHKFLHPIIVFFLQHSAVQ